MIRTAVRHRVGKIDLDPFDTATERDLARAEAAAASMLAAIPDGVREDDLARAIETGNAHAARFDAEVLDVDPLTEVLTAVYGRAAGDEGRSLRYAKAVETATVSLSFEFDMTNPEVARWAERNAAELVVEIDRGTRQTIRQLVLRAVVDGGHPRDLARAIRPNIGLHSRWATAVMNHRARLERAGVSGSRLASATAKYHDKLLKARALNIARTEVLKAANAGKLASWDQMYRQGYFGTTMPSKVWIAASDAEPVCAATDGQTVPLYDEFSNAMGSFPMPPAHPGCRCTAVIAPERPPSDPASAPRRFADVKDANAYGKKHWDPYLRSAPREQGFALDQYAASGYKDMNAALRYGDPVDPVTARWIENLAKLIDDAPRVPEDLVAQRTMGARTLTRQFGDEIVDDVSRLVGESFVDDGFVSTTLAPGKGEGWAFSMIRGKPVLVDVIVPQGSPGLYIEGQVLTGELELLLAPGSRFEIISALDEVITSPWGGPGETLDAIRLVVRWVSQDPMRPLNVVKAIAAAERRRFARFSWEPEDVRWE